MVKTVIPLVCLSEAKYQSRGSAGQNQGAVQAALSNLEAGELSRMLWSSVVMQSVNWCWLNYIKAPASALSTVC